MRRETLWELLRAKKLPCPGDASFEAFAKTREKIIIDEKCESERAAAADYFCCPFFPSIKKYELRLMHRAKGSPPFNSGQ